MSGTTVAVLTQSMVGVSCPIVGVRRLPAHPVGIEATAPNWEVLYFSVQRGDSSG